MLSNTALSAFCSVSARGVRRKCTIICLASNNQSYEKNHDPHRKTVSGARIGDFEQRHLPPQLQSIYRNSIMTGDQKLLLIKNSKAGCTSLASLLIEYSTGSKVPFEYIHLHRDGVFQGPYDWKKFDTAIKNELPLVFSFVRNPKDRLISCFFDFFVDYTNGNTNEHIGPISHRGFSGHNSLERNFEVFVDYVAESISIAPDYCNRHWREQTRNIGSDLIKIDFVGKLERYSADIQKLFDLVGETAFIDKHKDRLEKLNTSTKTA